MLAPVFTFHVLIKPSADPQTMHNPSDENATDITLRVFHSNGTPTICPVITSHIIMVESEDTDSTEEPSGVNDRAL